MIQYMDLKHKNVGQKQRPEHLVAEKINSNKLKCLDKQDKQCDNCLLQIQQNINTSEDKKIWRCGLCPSENDRFKFKQL